MNKKMKKSNIAGLGILIFILSLILGLAISPAMKNIIFAYIITVVAIAEMLVGLCLLIRYEFKKK